MPPRPRRAKPPKAPKIPTPRPPSVDLTPLTFHTDKDEAHYLYLVQQKLLLAKDLIDLETKHKLNTNRNMSRDPTALALAAPPIPMTNYTQECIRQVIGVRQQIEKCGQEREVGLKRLEELRNENRDGGEVLEGKIRDEEEAGKRLEETMQELGKEYLWAWEEVRDTLVMMLPAGDEGVKRGNAEIIMERVLGEMIVEVDEEAEKMEVESVGQM